jgi:hypothetical protein
LLESLSSKSGHHCGSPPLTVPTPGTKCSLHGPPPAGSHLLRQTICELSSSSRARLAPTNRPVHRAIGYQYFRAQLNLV